MTEFIANLKWRIHYFLLKRSYTFKAMKCDCGIGYVPKFGSFGKSRKCKIEDIDSECVYCHTTKNQLLCTTKEFEWKYCDNATCRFEYESKYIGEPPKYKKAKE